MTAGTTFGGILQAALPSDEKTQEKEGKNKEKKEKAWEHLGEQGRVQSWKASSEISTYLGQLAPLMA